MNSLKLRWVTTSSGMSDFLVGRFLRGPWRPGGFPCRWRRQNHFLVVLRNAAGEAAAGFGDGQIALVALLDFLARIEHRLHHFFEGAAFPDAGQVGAEFAADAFEAMAVMQATSLVVEENSRPRWDRPFWHDFARGDSSSALLLTETSRPPHDDAPGPRQSGSPWRNAAAIRDFRQKRAWQLALDESLADVRPSTLCPRMTTASRHAPANPRPPAAAPRPCGRDDCR